MMEGMPLTARHLHDVAFWAKGSGLEIVLLVVGTILLTRLATWLGARITHRIDENAQEKDALVRSEASKHRQALAQVIPGPSWPSSTAWPRWRSRSASASR